MFVTVQIEKGLYRELVEGAKLTGIEITQFVNAALEEWQETFGQALEPVQKVVSIVRPKARRRREENAG